MKILYVTTIAITMNFFVEHIKMLLEQGNTVKLACNVSDSELNEFYTQNNLEVYNIPFARSPLKTDNIKAYKELKRLLEKEKFDLIHTHTPTASVCVRSAYKINQKNGTKVIYTAHGFHFYKGAPLKNRLLFFPIEKLLSKYTDAIITINNEDYEAAKNKLKCKKVYKLHGVGVDTGKFAAARAEREETRKALGIPEDAFLLLSVGELNSNKNYECAIKAFASAGIPGAFYLLCGVGDKRAGLEALSYSLGIEKKVKFLGLRNDIPLLCGASDCFIHPSYREGLPVSIIEAMASGLPVICSDIRGCRDLITQSEGGFLIHPNDSSAASEALKILSTGKKLCKKYGEYNQNKSQYYDISFVLNELNDIYKAVITQE